jgi:pantoate--beta-alanine ligase
MGALHAGHISLVKEAQKHADYVVVSIFVNPTQFGPNEDFAKYPRTLEADCDLLRDAGCNAVFAPSADEMYAKGAVTRVVVPGISDILCGAFRPGHFDGVATVVTKLFMQALPDIALFGEKDYQQLAIIRQFTQDLNIPVEIIGVPIMREADGLAMSSRNRYLTAEQRAIAPKMYKILHQLSAVIPAKAGIHLTNTLGEARDELLKAGFTKIDYIELRDAATLEAVSQLTRPARLIAAAYIGTTRLIDNIEIT